MSKIRTLIVNTPGFQIGGVETYFHELMIDQAEKGARVIWITTPRNVQQAFFKDLVKNEKIEKVYDRDSTFRLMKKIPHVKLSKNEDIVMISFTPIYYIYAEWLRRNYYKKKIYIKHYLVLMNFFGASTYLEDAFDNQFLKKYWFKFAKKIANYVCINDNLLAFSQKQIIYYQDRYSLNIKNSEILSLPKYFPLEEPRYTDYLKRANMRNDEFIITACSRFEFPHKGFLVGIISLFPKILEIIPNSKLIIIGYGDDFGEAKIKSTIDTLDERVNSKIVLLGRMSPDELAKFYKESVLIVSLAGAALLGAKCGVPTLVTRHNSYSCETYGFFCDDDVTSLEEKPGYDILPYILRLKNMTTEDYVNLSISCFKKYQKSYNYDSDYLFKNTANTNKPLSLHLLLKGKQYLFFMKTIRAFKKIRKNKHE